MTTTTSQPATTVTVQLDAYVDAGTGYTSEQQHEWIARTRLALKNRLRYAIIVTAQRKWLHVEVADVPGDDCRLLVSLVAHAPGTLANQDERREMAAAWQAAEASGADWVRDAVAEILGRKSAYTTIY